MELLNTIVLLLSLVIICSVEARREKKCDISESTYSCTICLPQNEKKKNKQCIAERKENTAKAKHYYRLTSPIAIGEPNNNTELLLPGLDQSPFNVALVARFDELDSSWFSIYYTMITAINDTANFLMSTGFLYKPLKSYHEYKYIYDAFTKTLQSLPSPHLFAQPITDKKTFKDITIGDQWRDDRVFVQRRLAGQCPYFVRRVNSKFDINNPIGMSAESLLELLNDDFNWDDHLTHIHKTSITMKEAIEKDLLYVLYHDSYNDLPKTPDILDMNPYDDRKMMTSPSTITLFFLNDKGILIVVAIQLGYTKDSKVVSPRDNVTFKKLTNDFDWMRAKGFVEIVELAVCNLKGHYLETHATQEIFCNLYKRSLSKRHPLYQVISAHCQGTTPVGALGVSSLLDKGRYMHRLFDFGYIGAKDLINRCYESHTYAASDFELMLKRGGLDGKSIKYYPYREDGKLIWNEIKVFANKYVSLYYKNDKDVVEDTELNAFVNEVSADGDLPNGGRYKGFPSSFTTKKDVSTFLTRFIWLVVLHAANSYPLTPDGAYVPVMPSKLYSGGCKTGHDYACSLPDAAVVLTQTVLSFTLSGLRLNRLFDHANQLTDAKGRSLVKETYVKLNTCTQKILEERNKKRYQKGYLTYQYLEPKWLPNSIHI